MKEQQKRKIQQFHPEIEDGIDLRRCPPIGKLVDIVDDPKLQARVIDDNSEQWFSRQVTTH